MSEASSPPDTEFDAPIRVTGGRVQPDWIDYNGHMNVAYYTLAMDKALDAFLDQLGLGEDHVAAARMGPYSLQANYRYLDELLEGEGFAVDILLLDHDAKRMHLFLSMIRERDGALAATVETLLMNVDLTAKRAAPYPEAAMPKLAAIQAAHDALARPEGLGAPIGIRRT